MVYIIGWVANFINIAQQEILGYKGRFFLYLLILYYAGIAVLRGDVGTDTANYEVMLASFVDGYDWGGLEPGFFALGWGLVKLTTTPAVAVRTLALIFFIILVIFVSRSDKNERFLLMGYILPTFAFQYSMNGLRIGLASAVLLMAVQNVRRKGNVSSFKVGLFAILFHYSSAFSFVYIAVLQRKWLMFSSVVKMFFLLSVIGSVFISIDYYFLDKFDQYKAAYAPSALSGFSKIVPVALLTLGVMFGRLLYEDKAKIVFMSVAFAVIGVVITQFSYAGLRVLDLLSFAMPLSILVCYSNSRLSFDKSMKIAIAASGIASAVGVYRGFLLESGFGNSPFLPYEFYNNIL